MANQNIIKGTIKIEAPGIEKTTRKVADDLEKFQAQMKNVKGPTDSAAFALTNLGRVAQDAPFGFIAIQNNINPLLESFQRLQVQSKAAGVSLGSTLKSALIGPAGLGLAFSLGSALALKFGDDLIKLVGPLFKSASNTKILAETLTEAGKAAGEQIVRLEVYRQKLNDLTISENDRVKVAKQYNKIADENNKIDLKQIGNLDLLNNKMEAQNTLILKRAISTAAMARLTEESAKFIEKEIQLQERLSSLGFKDLDDYEKKQKKILDNRIKAFQQDPGKFQQQSQSFQQGLDGIVTPAQRAAASVIATDNSLNNLITDVKDGRKELLKFSASLQGLITIDGLTEKDPTKTKKKVESLIPVSVRPNFLPVGDLDQRISEFNTALRQRIQDQFSKLPAANVSTSFSVDTLKQLSTESEKLFAKYVAVPDLIVNTLTPAFQTMFNEIASGENAFKSLGNTVTGVLKKVAAEMAALAAVAAVLSVLKIAIGGPTGPKGFGNIFKYLVQGVTGIPLASGMWRVPEDGLPAVLHRNEMVLPAPLAGIMRSAFSEKSLSVGKFQSVLSGISTGYTGGGAQINSIAGALNIPSFVRLEAQGDALVGVLSLANQSQNRIF